MAKVRSAKQLTFLYFSIVAFAVIAIHATVLESTLERIEQLSIQNRLLLQKSDIVRHYKERGTYKIFKIDQFTYGYASFADLPEYARQGVNIPEDIAVELGKNEFIETEYFIMKYAEPSAKDGYIYAIQQDIAFELGEDEVLSTQSSQTLTTFALLVVSLLVVMRISERLTSPISLLAKQISARDPDDMSEIQLPGGVATKELLQLVDSFNHNQEKIKSLIERERSFNRLASHELRTPLMVMKGATSLLSHGNDPAFIKKQQSRLAKATTEMNDFIETLLSLTKSEKNKELVLRTIYQREIEQITQSHFSLIDDKPVKVSILMNAEPQIVIPEVGFKILLGNLVKNAFAYIEHGTVTIHVEESRIRIIDTGIGLALKSNANEGFGLGLLIAKDICRKYNWRLQLDNNEHGGCTANLIF